ncbi:PhnA domain-containing protein [Bradymonas sediminis]|uniref:PhnA domain protein n=1 Tax=Bradymonas sediminis TaxID=1548548 RepID=A0A2Z4FIU3_9DELT|nr:alkylphosphonate utilization protein [Bradymonas sediminis]AWV88745.1 PhnA domain protein [Bradymonas sediminis]TDP63562.1 protein PhnA [Bradymonas sediminis]
MSIEQALLERAEHQCELCTSTTLLRQFDVPSEEPRDDASIVICEVCANQLAAEDASELDSTHWYCLQGSVWSVVPAVKVLSWRVLNKLRGETWARDLMDQVYLMDDEMAWAKEGVVEVSDDAPPTLDSNGTQINDGDDVTLVRNLDVKGTNFIAKQGTRVKGVRLIDGDPENVEGKVNGITLVLKTKFLKRA